MLTAKEYDAIVAYAKETASVVNSPELQAVAFRVLLEHMLIQSDATLRYLRETKGVPQA